MKGYRSRIGSGIVFSRSLGFVDRPVTLPCGQCTGCRLERSRQWAVRCVHEAQLWDENCFITLTYDDEHLPSDGSLNRRHWQLFMKKLRKSVEPKRIRFYGCGEYGEKYHRPHFHACIFNHDFGDKTLWKVVNDVPLYQSEELSRLWGHGYCSVGAVTFQSAAYVARYIMKKITGEMASYHYVSFDPETGEIIQEVEPEFPMMSRGRGIGADWYDKFKTDCYPSDSIFVNGAHVRPPVFYDRRFEAEFPSDYARVKASRVVRGAKHADNNTPERLKVRKKVLDARLRLLPRNVE